MKRNAKLGYAILAIVFVLFSVIAFAVPTEKTATFWVAYGFSVVAFALQIGVWKVSFRDGKLRSKFLGIPIAYVSSIYLVVQLAAFLLFLIFPMIPTWIAVILCSLILGLSAICMLSVEVARGEINRVEQKVERKTAYMQNLRIEIELLAEQTGNADICALAERVRFSDPMSSPTIASVETEIQKAYERLVQMVSTGNHDEIHKITIEITHLLMKRNTLCKTVKR